MENRIVVGLGNPGSSHDGTRHNIGFVVIDELCRMQKCKLNPGHGQYQIHESVKGDVRTTILKPLTFMNNSGEAAAEALERFSAQPEDLLVVVDDLAIPLGTLRLRPQGTHGGHNGLRSLIYHLNTTSFLRLRCGIGPKVPPSGEERADFVLSPFERSEEPVVGKMILRAAEICDTFLASGMRQAVQAMHS